MTSMEIVQFSGSPTPLSNYVQNSSSLDLGRPISNEARPSPNDNQSTNRKHNPRMPIICYQVFP